MPTTNSERRRLALTICASSSLSNTTCVIPARSRTSMNSSPPRSRTRCTHPSSTTFAPTSPGRNAPQVWVRVSSPSGSATILQCLQSLANLRAGARLVVRVLRLRLEVLHGDRSSRDLVAAEERHERDAPGISVLDLLADLVRVGIHQHPQP